MRQFYILILLLFPGYVSVFSQEMGLKESKEFKGLGDYARQAQFSPYRYGSFVLYNPADKKYYDVIPLENPFHLDIEEKVTRSTFLAEPGIDSLVV